MIKCHAVPSPPNRQEALLAAISEKDANIALLELSSSKKKKTQDEVAMLKREKDRLVQQLKQQVGLHIRGREEFVVEELMTHRHVIPTYCLKASNIILKRSWCESLCLLCHIRPVVWFLLVQQGWIVGCGPVIQAHPNLNETLKPSSFPPCPYRLRTE